jgi:hypothetical protein
LKDKNENDKEHEKTIRSDLNTKMMEDKVEFEKRMALLSQENEYLKIKIEENDKYNDSNHRNQ